MNLKKCLYKNNRITYSIYVLLVVIDSLLSLVIAALLKNIIDVASSSSLSSFKLVVFRCSLLIAFIGLISISLYYFEALVVKRSLTTYKDTLYKELIKKAPRTFYNEKTSTYLSGMTNDVAVIENNYIKGTASLVANIVLFFGALGLMLYYSPLLSIVTIVFLAIPLLLSSILGNRLSEQEKTVSLENSNFMAFIQDLLNGFSVIKSFQAEHEVTGLFCDRDRKLERIKFNKNCEIGRIQTVLSLGGTLPQLGVLIFGAYFILRGNNLTVGILVSFTSLLGNFMKPIMSVPQLLSTRKAASSLIDKMEKELQNNLLASGEVLKEFPDAISLNNVSFGYEDNTILNNINLKLNNGESYAIVGESGSGKTTLVSLIAGMMDNYSGEILYDDTDLKNYNLDSISEQVSIIQQNVFIFDGTILDNITLFKKFDKDLIDWAIDQSGLRSIVNEKGINYHCGACGCNLSGGERQRISIARSILKQSKLFVADEATAALDNQTSHDVMTAILNIKDSTKLIITHKLDEKLLTKFDHILVIKNGSIFEQGTFDELMSKKEYFYSLYNVS